MAQKKKKVSSHKLSMNKFLIRGSFLFSLAIVSLASLGWSNWVASQSNSINIPLLVDTPSVEKENIVLFSLDEAKEGDALRYNYSSEGSSSGNGLISDETIGNVGNVTLRLYFDLNACLSRFNWDTINFEVSLSYASGVSGLDLLNSSTTANLKIAKTSKKSATSSSTQTGVATDANFTKSSASESKVTYTTSYTPSSDESLLIGLHFVMTYVFTVSDGALTAKNLSLLSSVGNIFSVNATASRGTTS